MATEGSQPFKITGLACGATTLAAKQYHFVKLHTDGTVIIPTAITDNVIGVLQNKPIVGEACEIVAVGETKISAGAAIAIGAIIGTATDGQAQTAVSTNKVCGSLGSVAAANADEIVTAYVNITQAIKV